MRAIAAHKLRSALTLIGMVVGVFSIIAVMTAMGVLRNSIEEGMTQLGANTFQIQKFPAGFNSGHDERRRLRNRKDITYEQAQRVRDQATYADAVGIEAELLREAFAFVCYGRSRGIEAATGRQPVVISPHPGHIAQRELSRRISGAYQSRAAFAPERIIIGYRVPAACAFQRISSHGYLFV